MPTLSAPNAELYYETVGTGPLLLCISGANGSAPIWRRLGNELQNHFQVVMYDRRGFSNSALTGPQDYTGTHRIETDTDDAKALIQHLSPNEPATVIGNSSGAIVSLMLLQRHPEVVRTLIAHEPPAEAYLDDTETWRAKQQDVYDAYRAGGPVPALVKFGDLIKATQADRAVMIRAFDARSGPHIAGNVMYWFEREFLPYVFHEFDIEKLKSLKSKLLLANGKESHPESPQYLCNIALGRRLGLEVDWFSGAHTAFAADPPVFAKELRGLLKARDAVYERL